MENIQASQAMLPLRKVPSNNDKEFLPIMLKIL